MKFTLTKPCANCPFRNDVLSQKGWLGDDRANSIYETLKAGGVFPCHKTVTYDDNDCFDDEDGDTFVHQESHIFCAGALIMLEKTGEAVGSNAIRIAERLGLYDHNKLDMESPVFSSQNELVNWHKNRN